MLRDLLREHLKRIYLYSYEESCNRAAAMDRTRRTILRVARTMQSVPAGCPFVTWIFLALEETRVPPVGNPDFWRLLVFAEEERRTANANAAKDGQTAPSQEVTSAQAPAGAAIEATSVTGSHPVLRPLVTLYHRFLDTPAAEVIDPRANWPAAETDLDCFLSAQFGEAGDSTCGTAPAWRRWLADRPWRRPRTIAGAAAAVVVIAISLVVGFTLAPPKGRRATVPGSARPPARDTTNRPIDATSRDVTEHSVDPTSRPIPGQTSGLPDSGSRAFAHATDCQIASVQAAPGLATHGLASIRINGARCELVTRDSLRFAWMPAQSVTEYRLCLITAKRDTLGIVPAITGTCVTVPVSRIPGIVVPGSFIFRLDGLAAGQLVAVSDPQPFEIP